MSLSTPWGTLLENNLLTSVKYRIFDEIRAAIQKNLVYKDKVECYAKFPMSEKPPIGIFLRNASSSRVKLSPDDFAGTLRSQFALAQVAQRAADGSLDAKPGRFLDWVWEDTTNLVKYQEDEDLSNQLMGPTGMGTNRLFMAGCTGIGYTGMDYPEATRSIVAGPNNTVAADNFRQVEVSLNGSVVHAELVDGNRGWVMLPTAPPRNSSLSMSYYYLNAAHPGRYYIEILPIIPPSTTPTLFTVDPLYTETKEKVIEKTTGTETSVSLQNPIGSVQLRPLVSLYTVQRRSDYKIELEQGSDYSVDVNGLITILHHLPAGATLYADYRWQGANLGNFTIPSDNHYNNTAIPGAILAFSNEIMAGDRLVVLAFPRREIAASVYSGHYNMSFEIDVFARDPIQLPDLTDHIISEIWNNRRLGLMDEGITITEMDPTGESEEPYDRNTGDLYYHNAISLQVMTEWKKFVPYVTEIKEFDINLYSYFNSRDLQYTKTFNFSDLLYNTAGELVTAINAEVVSGVGAVFLATLKNDTASTDLLATSGSLNLLDDYEASFLRTILPTEVFTLHATSTLGSGFALNSVTYEIPASRDCLILRASIRYTNAPVPPTTTYTITDQNKIMTTKLVPWSRPFEVKYPKSGYARYL